MTEIMNNDHFFTLSDSRRHLSYFHSVTMHRCYSPASPIEIFTGDFFMSSLKDEICSPIIKNRLKTNF